MALVRMDQPPLRGEYAGRTFLGSWGKLSGCGAYWHPPSSLWYLFAHDMGKGPPQGPSVPLPSAHPSCSQLGPTEDQ